MMKPSLIPALIATLILPLAAHAAPEKPFSFTVVGTTLHIVAPDGKEVGTLPPATIARTVDVPPSYSFQVSFGNDANGNLSVIVTPNPDRPTPLSFIINNRSVQMDKSAIVTITLAAGGATTVDPGASGGVRVDNHAALAATTSAGAASTASSAPANGAPSSQTAPAADNAQANTNPSNLANVGNSATADPTAPALGTPSSQASFNSNPQSVLQANNPQTSASPTTPF